MKSFYKKYIKENWFLIISLIMLFLMCYFFPYSHDDWAWGSEMGLEKLHTLFENYNGRYAGNISIIILSRCKILRAIFEFTILYLTIKNMNKIINRKDINLTFLIIILLLIMPVRMFASTISWASGFCNYVPPVLVCLYFISYNLNNKDHSNKWYYYLLFFLLSFIGSLFMENITTYNLVLSIFAFIYFRIKNKKISYINLFYLIGSICGTVLMFTNSGYRTVAAGEDWYRLIQKNGLLDIIDLYFYQIRRYLVLDNKVLNLFLCFAIFVLVFKYIKKNNSKNHWLYYSLSIDVLYFIYTMFTLIKDGYEIGGYDFNCYFSGIFIFIWAISIIYDLIVCIDEKMIRNKCLFYIGSIVVLVGPLFFVLPIGSRCFLCTYIFFMLLALEIYNYTNIKINEYVPRVLCLGILSPFFILFLKTYKIDMERIDYITSNKDLDVIYIPNFPNEAMLWGATPNPKSEEYPKRFKIFYKLNMDSTIEVLDYKTWKKYIKKQEVNEL